VEKKNQANEVAGQKTLPVSAHPGLVGVGEAKSRLKKLGGIKRAQAATK